MSSLMRKRPPQPASTRVSRRGTVPTRKTSSREGLPGELRILAHAGDGIIEICHGRNGTLEIRDYLLSG